MAEYKYGAIVELYATKIVNGSWSADRVVERYKELVAIRVQELLAEKEKGEQQ